MPAYSPSLRVELITSGDQAGQWGNTTNSNFQYIFDSAIAGYVPITVLSTDHVLTYSNGPVADENLNQSIAAMLQLNSAAAAFNVFAPPVSKQYIIWNNSGYAATIYNSTAIGNTTAAGTGVTIADGDRVIVLSDGTDFYTVKSSGITGVLLPANGGTGATSFTAGALLKGAGSSAVTVASAADIVGQIGATAVTNATNIAGGAAGQIPYQTGAGTTGFIAAGGSGQILQALGTSSPVWRDQSSANVVNAIVARDGSGNFVAGTITANLTGTATNATNLVTSNWTVLESGGFLYFKYGGVNKMRLDSSGNMVVSGNVTAYGSI